MTIFTTPGCLVHACDAMTWDEFLQNKEIEEPKEYRGNVDSEMYIYYKPMEMKLKSSNQRDLGLPVSENMDESVEVFIRRSAETNENILLRFVVELPFYILNKGNQMTMK